MSITLDIAHALASGSILALPLSFAGGLLAGFAPCNLALYPAASASCCAGRSCGCDSAQASARDFFSNNVSLASSIFFLLGIAAAMTILGVAVSLAGHITGFGSIGHYIVAAVMLIMGMQMLGWIHLPLEHLSGLPIQTGGSFGVGFVLAFALAPCGAPLLAPVLSYAAYQGHMLYGAALLFLFGIGAGTPLLLAGTVASGLARRLDQTGWRIWIDRATGILLLLVGYYLLWNA